MKSSFAIAALAVGAAAMPGQVLQKRQNIPTAMINMVNGMINPHGGKVADPPGAAPKRVELAARVKADNAKTIKLRHGPYKVPNMKSKNMMGEEGSLWNFGDTEVAKPCADKCTIVGITAGLEYADGTNANIDTGMWLHHMVLINAGPGRSDPTCNWLPISPPHMIAGAFPKTSERLFASGNERTKVILEKWGFAKTGYKINKRDKFSMIVDLMNENMADKVVYLTMTYDIVDGNPEDYDNVKPVWFDVAQCLTSEWPAPYNNGSYSIPATTWKANIDGEVLGAIGHLHDGGQRVTLAVDGKKVCSSDAAYAEKPEYVSKSDMGHHGSATEHISSMTACVNGEMGIKEVKKGQVWQLKAEYDYEKNKGVLHENGKQENVMGIAIMWVREKTAKK